MRAPDGEYSERHVPLDVERAYTLTTHDRVSVVEEPPETDENGVRAPRAWMAKLRARASRFYYRDAVGKVTEAELHEARHHHDGHDYPELEAGSQEFRGVSETGIPRSH